VRMARIVAAMKGMLAAVVCLFALCSCSTSHLAATPGAQGFDGDLAGWRAASTGGSGPDATWTPQADVRAISPGRVLSLTAPNHTAEDRFNLFWSPGVRFHDGRLAVAVRADGGTVDQGGGPIWRAQDANNYYVCRFNPLESNYRVYVVQNGVRRQLATALVTATTGSWHRVEVEHVGDRITCWLDGAKLLEASDGTIAGEGGVGLWTKADARTSFDDLMVSGK
jgi:hypothetical protein